MLIISVQDIHKALNGLELIELCAFLKSDKQAHIRLFPLRRSSITITRHETPQGLLMKHKEPTQLPRR